VTVILVVRYKHNRLHCVCEDDGICAGDCTVHRYTVWPECTHVECSVHIVTTVLYTVNGP
jgi:hypothetical protein